MLGPSAEADKLKFRVWPKITGYASRTMSLTMGWPTSASSRKVVVSDQFRTETLTFRPPRERSSNSTLAKGHGPAMQETLAFRNSFPSPASKDAEASVAFHFPSGEHGGRPWQGTLPAFTTWKVFTALPISASVVVFTEYRTLTFATPASGRPASTWVS